MQKTKLTSIYDAPLPTELRIHIDEAGRGPLAWPVAIGCTLSIQQTDLSMFRDSKAVGEKERERLYNQAQQLEQDWKVLTSVAFSDAAAIDDLGIIQTLHDACLEGIFMVLKKYFALTRSQQLQDSVYGEDHIALTYLSKLFRKRKIKPEVLYNIIHTPNSVAQFKGVIIDGNHSLWLDDSLDTKVITIIKGDSKNPLISMSSIIAKVTRDRWMCKVATLLPRYWFESHKGYGTKKHRQSITKYWLSQIHRKTYCGNIKVNKKIRSGSKKKLPKNKIVVPNTSLPTATEKPKLLLHICCAPDLARPLHWLKNHFKLYLFWYNPNIHPRAEHTKRYDSFIKLVWLEKGDYEIVEDRYDPKEFFKAMVDEKEDIDPNLKNATPKQALKVAGEMEERSSRCNPCYSMRLAEAAKNAAKHNVSYFTSTLLISPKKKMDKLFRRWLEWERRHPSTKFLWFNFAKNKGYEHATRLTKKHNLFRQNYCGCWRTIPKKWEKIKNYTWG